MNTELNPNNETGTGQPLQSEDTGTNGSQTGSEASTVSSERQTPKDQMPGNNDQGRKSEKFPFGPGIFTTDKELVNEYLQLAQKHFGADIAKRPIIEQFNILFYRINKFVTVLHVLKEGSWRKCARSINTTCNEYLSEGQHSKSDKKNISRINIFLIDLMFLFLENRYPFEVVYRNYLHHQKQLSFILKKKPEITEIDATETLDTILGGLDQIN